MKVGYRRVSTLEQSLDLQDLGECNRVFEEQDSAAAANCPALQDMLSFERSGGEIVLHSIDRRARNSMDLQSIILELNDKGLTIRSLTESLSFTAEEGCAFHTLRLQMLSAFAQFKRSMIHKRKAKSMSQS